MTDNKNADNKRIATLRDAIATASMAYAGCAAEEDDPSKCRIHGVHWSSKGICLKMLAHANNVLLTVLESIEVASHHIEIIGTSRRSSEPDDDEYKI